MSILETLASLPIIAELEVRGLRINIEDRNGLFVATSPNLPGLLVVRNTREDILDAIPQEIIDLVGQDDVLICPNGTSL